MHGSSRRRLLVVLTTVFLLATLAMPALTFAAVGGPYSESPSNPEDNGVVGPSGGSLDLHGYGRLVIPEGALAEATSISGQVWNVRGGPRTSLGHEMRTLVQFSPDGTTFATPATLEFTIPPDITLASATIYGWNPDLERWESMITSPTNPANRSRLIRLEVHLPHFSWYGIGGTPITTSTPASADWSIALAAIAALGVAIGLRRSMRTRLG